jgi:hypothetical protein
MDPTPATILWSAAAALVAIAFASALMERRRARRADLDAPGVMPWHLLQILAFLLAVVAAAIALKV